MRRWALPGSAAAVGFARRDITPRVGFPTRNWALATTQVSTGVHRPLLATVMVMASQGSEAVIASLDMGWWRSAVDERGVRGAVLDAAGLDESQLLVHLFHTHAGPYTHPEAGSPSRDEVAAFLKQLGVTLAELVAEARAKSVEAEIAWTSGSCRLATNRDLPVGDREVIGFYPEGVADDTLLVGRVTDSAGRALGTIVNYACHPTTLSWRNTLFSPDWVGAARELIEHETGAPSLFLQGASGELSPRDQATDNVATADSNGRQVGHAVLALLEGMPGPGVELVQSEVVESGAPLGLWTPSPHRANPALKTLHKRLPIAAIDPNVEGQWSKSAPSEQVVRERRLRRSLLADGYVSGDTAMHPVWVWRMGDAYLVAHPGEAYSALQTTLRARHPGVPIVVMNITNGPGFVYMPPEHVYARNAYPVWQTLAGPGGLERLIEAADAAIASLMDDAAPAN
ncbi:MAG: hypothetical protein ACO1OG_01715 [Devosia sp.]